MKCLSKTFVMINIQEQLTNKTYKIIKIQGTVEVKLTQIFKKRYSSK